MWIITRSNNPTVSGALKARGVVTLYPNEESAWTAWKLFLSRDRQEHYTVRSVEVLDET